MIVSLLSLYACRFTHFVSLPDMVKSSDDGVRTNAK